MNVFESQDALLKSKLLGVTRSKAEQYIHNLGYTSSTFLMPEYYQASGFSDIKLKQLTFKRNGDGDPKRTKSISMITPKGKMTWRTFNLLHPYAYWHIASLISDEGNWKTILGILTKNTGVAVYSVPRLDTQALPQGLGIQSWKQMAQKDVVKDMSGLKYCAYTDIKNFYPSIYTHSIAWAIEGKEESRATKELFGNHLDKLFQNAREGQTNGIPTGSVVSDMIAEIILSRIDSALAGKLKERGLVSKIVRYRDDYRIYCNTRSDAEEALKIMSRLLQSQFDLHINEDKTKIVSDALAESIRPWETEFINSALLNKLFTSDKQTFSGSDLFNILMAVYDIQKRYPQSRAATQVLSRLSKKITKTKNFKVNSDSAEILVPLIRKIILLREDVTPNAMLFMDIILGSLSTDIRAILFKEMHDSYLNDDDNEYQEIWLYRVCLHHNPELIDELFGASRNPLIRMLDGDSKPHYEYFEAIDIINIEDKVELEKFSFVDYTKLADASNKPITAQSIALFKY